MKVHSGHREVIEKEVIKEVRVGVSEEELAAIEQRAAEEKQILMKQAQEDMRQLINQNSKTAQERAELQSALDREAEDKRIIEEQKQKLVAKLQVIYCNFDHIKLLALA